MNILRTFNGISKANRKEFALEAVKYPFKGCLFDLFDDRLDIRKLK